MQGSHPLRIFHALLLFGSCGQNYTPLTNLARYYISPPCLGIIGWYWLLVSLYESPKSFYHYTNLFYAPTMFAFIIKLTQVCG